MAEVDQLTSALQKVLNHGIYQNNLARGLNEACKALEYEHDSEEHRASLCILATNCEDDNYKKLITGLCKTWKVKLLTVDDRVELGKMAGLFKSDASGVARKVRPCSCVVVKRWPEAPDMQSSVTVLKAHTAA